MQQSSAKLKQTNPETSVVSEEEEQVAQEAQDWQLDAWLLQPGILQQDRPNNICVFITVSANY